MTSVGSIVGGGFRLIRERPVAVVIWAALYALLGFGSQMLALRMVAAVRVGPGEAPDPSAMMGMFGAMLPIYLLLCLLGIVMLCASYRAVLRPGESGFGYLRIGMDELRMLGLFLIIIVVAIVGGFILVLLMSMIAGGLMLAAGNSPLIGLVLGGGLYIAMLGAMIYIYVRLSLMFPLTFARRRISIDGAWALTRGRFWTLFGAYFVIGVISFVLLMAVSLPFTGPMFAGMIEGIRNPQAMEQIQAAQMERQMNQPLAMTALITILNAIVQAVLLALSGGATATATRELLADSGEVLEEDAEATAAIFE